MLGIVDSIVGVAGKVLDKFVEDKDLKTRLDFELRKAYADANLGQIEINKESAKHPSIFVAGARPSILWICAFGLAWQFIFQPVAVWYMALTASPIILPIIPTEGLLSLTLALLGLGGMRTFEKRNNTHRNNMKHL
jgi:hypothetical protein